MRRPQWWKVRPSTARRTRAAGQPAAAGTESLEDRRLLTFNIVFNYSLDSSGFFNDQTRRDALERVATVLESRISDDLAAINPGGTNHWSATMLHPSTGLPYSIVDLQVPTDTLIIFVGGRDLGSPTILGQGGPGSFTFPAGNSAVFNTTLQTRGEAGVNIANPAASTDFAPWGGTLTFNPNSDWYFGTSDPPGNKADFHSLALHEMGHLLGVGLAQSWNNQVNGSNQFTGARARADQSSAYVPLTADKGHWANNTTSLLPGTATEQQAGLTAQIILGSRKHFTNLDWAGLHDIGWEILPVIEQRDYGDAPDAVNGTAAGNYNTRAADNGPSHVIGDQVHLGLLVDADNGLQQNPLASADDANSDDEDGVANPGQQLTLTRGATPRITVSVTNQTTQTATVYGWIDYNGNGIFENSTERAQTIVPAGTAAGTVTLAFTPVPSNAVTSTFARFRISTSPVAANPTGAAPDGEVEDYPVSIPLAATLDVDGNGVAQLFTDGILIVRHMLNFGGTALTNGAIGAGATRTTAAQISAYLNAAQALLDADGNGQVDAFTDGILISRFLVPFTGNALIQNAVGPGATRTTAAAVTAHLSGYLPSPVIRLSPAAPVPVTSSPDPASPPIPAALPPVPASLTDSLFTAPDWLDESPTLPAELGLATVANDSVRPTASGYRRWAQVISSQ